jgi:hypothetical protein
MTTQILFDVDGVFNAFGRTLSRSVESTGWADWETTYVEGYKIIYAPELIERVNALAAREDVQAQWLTTWCDLAPKSLAPALGIDGADWPVIGKAEDAASTVINEWWKLTKVREVFTITADPIIWIDDDHGWNSTIVDAWMWARVQRTGGDVYKLSPNPNFGITRNQMEYIESLV